MTTKNIRSQTILALESAARSAMPHLKIELIDSSDIGRPRGGLMLAAYLPGNPLYTAQLVGLDESTKSMGWAGEQDAGDDLWKWLGTQGWGTRLSPEDSAILQTADSLRNATMTEDEKARSDAEDAEKDYLIKNEEILDRITKIQENCAVLYSDGTIARYPLSEIR